MDKARPGQSSRAEGSREGAGVRMCSRHSWMVFEAQLDGVQGTAGSRTGHSWITHRGQPKTELMQGKAALRLPKMPLLTNPLQSQLNHSSVPGG